MRSRLQMLLPKRPRTAPDLNFADYVAERVGIWTEAAPVPGALVFLGDSQIERGRWNEWFWRAPVLNRGIGGETIAGVAARLDEVIRHAPPLIVLECGANDLAANTGLDKSARDFEELLASLCQSVPSCVLWAQSVLPAHPVHWREMPPSQSGARAQELNAQIKQLNAQIKKWARAAGAHFLDLHPFFEQDGALRGDCTLDGLHLNGVGYRVWREALNHSAPPEIAAILDAARG